MARNMIGFSIGYFCRWYCNDVISQIKLLKLQCRDKRIQSFIITLKQIHSPFRFSLFCSLLGCLYHSSQEWGSDWHFWASQSVASQQRRGLTICACTDTLCLSILLMYTFPTTILTYII